MIWVILKAVAVLSVVMTLWLAVQIGWKKQMGVESLQDPLATRLGCRDCQCHFRCNDNNQTTVQDDKHDSMGER